MSAASDEDLIVRGSGDFLADQGIADPDQFRVKSHLCHEIASIAEARKLTHAAVAQAANEQETDIRSIISQRHDGYGVWRLLKILSALGADVLIAINPCGTGGGAGIIHSMTVDPEIKL